MWKQHPYFSNSISVIFPDQQTDLNSQSGPAEQGPQKTHRMRLELLITGWGGEWNLGRLNPGDRRISVQIIQSPALFLSSLEHVNTEKDQNTRMTSHMIA